MADIHGRTGKCNMDIFDNLPDWEDWDYSIHSDFENAYHDAAVRPDECRRILGLPQLEQGDA